MLWKAGILLDHFISWTVNNHILTRKTYSSEMPSTGYSRSQKCFLLMMMGRLSSWKQETSSQWDSIMKEGKQNRLVNEIIVCPNSTAWRASRWPNATKERGNWERGNWQHDNHLKAYHMASVSAASHLRRNPVLLPSLPDSTWKLIKDETVEVALPHWSDNTNNMVSSCWANVLKQPLHRSWSSAFTKGFQY